VLNLFGYYYYGLEGLGISSLVYYAIHLLIMIIIARKYYKVFFDTAFKKVFLYSILMCTAVFMLSYIDTNEPLKYGTQVVVFLMALGYSGYQLNQKMDIKGVINQFLNRKK